MSSLRIESTERGAAIRLIVDGAEIACFAGETVATAMLTADRLTFRRDTDGRARGMFCNMGSCCECMVTLVASGRRVRACLTEAADGLEIATHG